MTPVDRVVLADRVVRRETLPRDQQDPRLATLVQVGKEQQAVAKLEQDKQAKVAKLGLADNREMLDNRDKRVKRETLGRLGQLGREGVLRARETQAVRQDSLVRGEVALLVPPGLAVVAIVRLRSSGILRHGQSTAAIIM